MTIVFLSFYSTSNKKELYFEKVLEVKKLQQKALEFKTLTNTWINEKFVNNTIDEILKSSIFKNEQIIKTTTKESVKIKIESSNPQILDTFINKILNKELVIKKLELTRNSIDLEIGIK